MGTAFGTGSRAEQIALLDFAGELFAALVVELSENLPDFRELIDRIESVAGIPRVALGHEVLRAPQLLQLPTAVSTGVQLTLLLAFANAQAVSLWTLDQDGALKHIAHAGEGDLGARDTRRLASRLLTDESVTHASDRSGSGILVDRGQQWPAVAIVRGNAASPIDRDLLLDSVVPTLSATLMRDELVSRGGASRQSPSGSSERMLTRLRFDLHDGPQQDVIMLAEDLRLFRDQLASVIGSAVSSDRVLGRIDDLEARLVALDGDLRRISASLESPFLQRASLPDAIAEVADAFTARTTIEPQLELHGELTHLTDSQQITLLALIREALANIREHTDAEHVTISLSAGSLGVDATVTDDGHGFDPEKTLISAARDGHLGLVGMHERVRLLGGQTKIDSRPGGPTVISVSLPAWPRPAED